MKDVENSQKLWEHIEEEYKSARACLVCPRHQSNWSRNEDTGMYHLYCAYQMARTSITKQHLLYARILSLMSWENRNISEYEKLHKFLKPALDEYGKALEEDGPKPFDKELEGIRQTVAELTYLCERTSNSKEEINRAYGLLEGHELLDDFEFHDSKPVYFEHTSDRALLKLNYGGIIATFEFTGLYDIEINGDPKCNWIPDFYCYHSYWKSSCLVFDIGYYKVYCEHIRVATVERAMDE